LVTPASIEPSGKYPVLVEQTDEQSIRLAPPDEQAASQEPPGNDSTLLVDTSSVLTAEPGFMQAEPGDAAHGVDMSAVDMLAMAMPTVDMPTFEFALGLGLAPKPADELSSTPASVSARGLLEMPREMNIRSPTTPPPPLPDASISKPPNAMHSTRPFTFPSVWAIGSKLQPMRLFSRGAGGEKKKYLWVWVVSLLAILAAGVVLAWPTPMGNVLVEMPEALAGGKVHLFVNEKEMLDKDGGPIQTWPRLFRVPAGKARISLSAEGYEPLVVDMVVPKGQNYVRLPKTLQKQNPPPEAPQDL
jgi:hypothetical protein